MRKRRRARYTWFPVTGSINDDASDPELGKFLPIFLTLSGAPTIPTGTLEMGMPAIIPLTFDNPDSEIDPSTLTDSPTLGQLLAGRDYVIKRIVGSIQVAYNTPQTDVARSVVVGAGIFVARASAGSPGQPIGTAGGTAAELSDLYGVLHRDNAESPWIWRRTWILGNPNSTNGSSNPFVNSPFTNQFYGDVRSGPHIDSKVSRRITREDRLWLTYQVANTVHATDPAQTTSVDTMADLRILGALRKPHNRSAF